MNVTFAPHWSASFDTLMLDGHERLQAGSVRSKVLMALAPLLSGLMTPTRHGPRISVVLQAAGIAAFDAGNVYRKVFGSAVIGTGVYAGGIGKKVHELLVGLVPPSPK